MSGIFGVFNRDGAPVDSDLLRALGAPLAFRGLDGDGYWHEGAVGLGCQINRITPESVNEIQPAQDQAGRVVVFDGRLDNREELLSQIEVDAGAPDSAFVLAAYERWGDKVPEHLLGDFGFGLWDPRARQLLLARDQVGVRPLYYYCGRELCLFGSEIKAILAHPRVVPEPDVAMLADYMIRDRQDLWGITFFRDIISLPPGHCVRITAGHCRQEQYWDFNPARQVRLRSTEEYVEAFREVWFRAVRRRLRSRFPVAVSLSGGVDSSSVYCTAQVLSNQIAGSPRIIGAFQSARPGTPAHEQQYVDELEQMYHTPVERVPIEFCSQPLAGANEQVWYNEGPWLDLQWGNMHPFLSRVRDLGTRVMLTGSWGDQMLAEQAYLLDLVAQFRWREAGRHLAEIPRWFTDAEPAWFRRVFYREASKLLLPNMALRAYRHIRDEWRRPRRDRKWYTESFRRHATWSGWDYSAFPSAATHRSRYLYQLCRSRHVLAMEQNYKRAGMHGVEVSHPFLDRDLIGFLMAIPGEASNIDGVPKGILRRAVTGIVPDSIVNRKWKADFTFLENDAARQGFGDFRQFVCSQDAAVVQFGLVDAAIISRQFASLEEKLESTYDCSLSWELSDLIAIELWLQVFFRGSMPHRSTGEVAYAAV